MLMGPMAQLAGGGSRTIDGDLTVTGNLQIDQDITAVVNQTVSGDITITGTGQLFPADGTDADPAIAWDANTGIRRGAANQMILVTGGAAQLLVAGGVLRIASTGQFGWSINTNPTSAADIQLFRGGAGILEQRSGTTAQTNQIYGTFTDASNYTRASLADNGSGTVTLAAETAGTGADDVDIVLTPAGTGDVILTVGSLICRESLDSVAVADEVSISRFEIGAGNTVLAISQETVVAVEVDETKFSHKMQVRLNGVNYFMMLTQT